MFGVALTHSQQETQNLKKSTLRKTAKFSQGVDEIVDAYNAGDADFHQARGRYGGHSSNESKPRRLI